MIFQIENKNIHASDAGQGIDSQKETIVFLHGSGLSHIVWSLTEQFFSNKNFNVLSVDLPGHGNSDGPCLDSIEKIADWLEKVFKKLDLKNLILVGHSQGCLVTMECVAQHSEKIKTLTLMGGASAIPMNPELLSLAEESNPKAVDLMMDFAHGPAGHFGGHPVPGLYHLNVGSMIVQNKEIKDTLGVDFRACDNYKNGPEIAKKLDLPTLSILGAQDRMCRLKDGKILADYIKGSEVHVIENCGHMMLLEEADQTLEILKKFILENDPIK